MAWLCRAGKARGAMRRLGTTCAKRVLCSRPEHARNVLDEMPWHAGGFQTARGLAGWGYRLGKHHWTGWFGQGIKFIEQTQTHVKTDHAHKVFDKMLRALRQVLEWPKTPDGGLFRCIRGW